MTGVCLTPVYTPVTVFLKRASTAQPWAFPVSYSTGSTCMTVWRTGNVAINDERLQFLNDIFLGVINSCQKIYIQSKKLT